MVCLPDGKKSFTICFAISTEYRRVTDGQTDGQTYYHSIVRTTHTRGMVITLVLLTNLVEYFLVAEGCGNGRSRIIFISAQFHTELELHDL